MKKFNCIPTTALSKLFLQKKASLEKLEPTLDTVDSIRTTAKELYMSSVVPALMENAFNEDYFPVIVDIMNRTFSAELNAKILPEIQYLHSKYMNKAYLLRPTEITEENDTRDPEYKPVVESDMSVLETDFIQEDGEIKTAWENLVSQYLRGGETDRTYINHFFSGEFFKILFNNVGENAEGFVDLNNTLLSDLQANLNTRIQTQSTSKVWAEQDTEEKRNNFLLHHLKSDPEFLRLAMEWVVPFLKTRRIWSVVEGELRLDYLITEEVQSKVRTDGGLEAVDIKHEDQTTKKIQFFLNNIPFIEEIGDIRRESKLTIDEINHVAELFRLEMTGNMDEMVKKYAAAAKSGDPVIKAIYDYLFNPDIYEFNNDGIERKSLWAIVNNSNNPNVSTFNSNILQAFTSWLASGVSSSFVVTGRSVSIESAVKINTKEAYIKQLVEKTTDFVVGGKRTLHQTIVNTFKNKNNKILQDNNTVVFDFKALGNIKFEVNLLSNNNNGYEVKVVGKKELTQSDVRELVRALNLPDEYRNKAYWENLKNINKSSLTTTPTHFIGNHLMNILGLLQPLKLESVDSTVEQLQIDLYNNISKLTNTNLFYFAPALKAQHSVAYADFSKTSKILLNAENNQQPSTINATYMNTILTQVSNMRRAVKEGKSNAISFKENLIIKGDLKIEQLTKTQGDRVGKEGVKDNGLNTTETLIFHIFKIFGKSVTQNDDRTSAMFTFDTPESRENKDVVILKTSGNHKFYPTSDYGLDKIRDYVLENRRKQYIQQFRAIRDKYSNLLNVDLEGAGLNSMASLDTYIRNMNVPYSILNTNKVTLVENLDFLLENYIDNSGQEQKRLVLNPVLVHDFSVWANSDLTEAKRLDEISKKSFYKFLSDNKVTPQAVKSMKLDYKKVVDSFHYLYLLSQDQFSPFLVGTVYQHGKPGVALTSEFTAQKQIIADRLNADYPDKTYTIDDPAVVSLAFQQVHSTMYGAKVKRHAPQGSHGQTHLFLADGTVGAAGLTENHLHLEVEEYKALLDIMGAEQSQEVHDGGILRSFLDVIKTNESFGGVESPLQHGVAVKPIHVGLDSGAGFIQKNAEFALFTPQMLKSMSPTYQKMFKLMHSMPFVHYHPSGRPLIYQGNEYHTLYDLYWGLGGPNNANVGEEMLAVARQADLEWLENSGVEYKRDSFGNPVVNLGITADGSKQLLYANSFIAKLTPPSSMKTGGSYKHKMADLLNADSTISLKIRPLPTEGLRTILQTEKKVDTTGSLDGGKDATIAIFTQALSAINFGEDNRLIADKIDNAMESLSMHGLEMIKDRFESAKRKHAHLPEDEAEIASITEVLKELGVQALAVQGESGQATKNKLEFAGGVVIDSNSGALLASAFKSYIEQEAVKMRLPGAKAVTTPSHGIVMVYEHNGRVFKKEDFFNLNHKHGLWVSAQELTNKTELTDIVAELNRFYSDFDKVLYNNRLEYYHVIKNSSDFTEQLLAGSIQFVKLPPARDLNYIMYPGLLNNSIYAEYKKLIRKTQTEKDTTNKINFEQQLSGVKLQLQEVLKGLKGKAAEVITPMYHAAVFNLNPEIHNLVDVIGFSADQDSQIQHAAQFFKELISNDDKLLAKYDLDVVKLLSNDPEYDWKAHLRAKNNSTSYPMLEQIISRYSKKAGKSATPRFFWRAILDELVSNIAKIQSENFHESLKSFSSRTPTQGKGMSTAQETVSFMTDIHNCALTSAISLNLAGEDHDNDSRGVMTKAFNNFGQLYSYNEFVDSKGFVTPESIALARRKHENIYGKKHAARKIFNNKLKNGLVNYLFDLMYGSQLEGRNALEIFTPNDMQDLRKIASETLETLSNLQEDSEGVEEIVTTALNAIGPSAMFELMFQNKVGGASIGIGAVGMKTVAALIAADVQSPTAAAQFVNLNPRVFSTLADSLKVDMNTKGILFFKKNVDGQLETKVVDNFLDNKKFGADAIARRTALVEGLESAKINVNPDDEIAVAEAVSRWISENQIDIYYNKTEPQWFALSKILSAATDNAKELILYALGIDENTINIYVSGLALGLEMTDIVDIFLRNNKELMSVVSEWKALQKLGAENTETLQMYIKNYLIVHEGIINSDPKFLKAATDVQDNITRSRSELKLLNLTNPKVALNKDAAAVGQLYLHSLDATGKAYDVYLKLDDTTSTKISDTVLVNVGFQNGAVNLKLPKEISPAGIEFITKRRLKVLSGTQRNERIEEINQNIEKNLNSSNDSLTEFLTNPIRIASYLMDVGLEMRAVSVVLSYNQGIEKNTLGYTKNRKSIERLLREANAKGSDWKLKGRDFTVEPFFQALKDYYFSPDADVREAAANKAQEIIDDYETVKKGVNFYAAFAPGKNKNYVVRLLLEMFSDEMLSKLPYYRMMERFGANESADMSKAIRHNYGVVSLLSYFSDINKAEFKDYNISFEREISAPEDINLIAIDDYLTNNPLAKAFVTYDPIKQSVVFNLQHRLGRHAFFVLMPEIVAAYRDFKEASGQLNELHILKEFYQETVNDGSSLKSFSVLRLSDVVDNLTQTSRRLRDMKILAEDSANYNTNLFTSLFYYFQIFNKGAKGGILNLFHEYNGLGIDNSVGDALNKFYSHQLDVKLLGDKFSQVHHGLLNPDAMPKLSTKLRNYNVSAEFAEEMGDLEFDLENIGFDFKKFKNSDKVNVKQLNQRKKNDPEKFPDVFRSWDTGWPYAYHPEYGYIRIERVHTARSLNIDFTEAGDEINKTLNNMGWHFGILAYEDTDRTSTVRVLVPTPEGNRYYVQKDLPDGTYETYEVDASTLQLANPNMLFEGYNFGYRERNELNKRSFVVKEVKQDLDLTNEVLYKAALNHAVYIPLSQDLVTEQQMFVGKKIGEKQYKGTTFIATLERPRILPKGAFTTIKKPEPGGYYAVWRPLGDPFTYSIVSTKILPSYQTNTIINKAEVRAGLVSGVYTAFSTKSSVLRAEIENNPNDTYMIIKDSRTKQSILAKITLYDEDINSPNLQKRKSLVGDNYSDVNVPIYKVEPIHERYTFNNSYAEATFLENLLQNDNLEINDDYYRGIEHTNVNASDTVVFINGDSLFEAVNPVNLSALELSIVQRNDFNLNDIIKDVNEYNLSEPNRPIDIKTIEKYLEVQEQLTVTDNLNKHMLTAFENGKEVYLFNTSLNKWFVMHSADLLVPASIPYSDSIAVTDLSHTMDKEVKKEVLTQIASKRAYITKYVEDPLQEKYRSIDLPSDSPDAILTQVSDTDITFNNNNPIPEDGTADEVKTYYVLDEKGEKVSTTSNDFIVTNSVIKTEFTEGFVVYTFTTTENNKIRTKHYVKLSTEQEVLLQDENSLLNKFGGISKNKMKDVFFKVEEETTGLEHYHILNDTYPVFNYTALVEHLSHAEEKGKILQVLRPILETNDRIKETFKNINTKLIVDNPNLRLKNVPSMLAYLSSSETYPDDLKNLQDLWNIYKVKQKTFNIILNETKLGLTDSLPLESILNIGISLPNTTKMSIGRRKLEGTRQVYRSDYAIQMDVLSIIKKAKVNTSTNFEITLENDYTVANMQDDLRSLAGALSSRSLKLPKNVVLSAELQEAVRNNPYGHNLIPVEKLKAITPYTPLYQKQDIRGVATINVFSIMKGLMDPTNPSSPRLIDELNDLYNADEEYLVKPENRLVKNSLVTTNSYKNVLRRWVVNNNIYAHRLMSDINQQGGYFKTNISSGGKDFAELLAAVLNEVYTSEHSLVDLLRADEVQVERTQDSDLSTGITFLSNKYLYAAPGTPNLKNVALSKIIKIGDKFYKVLNKRAVSKSLNLPGDFPNDFVDDFLGAPRDLFILKEIKDNTVTQGPHDPDKLVEAYNNIGVQLATDTVGVYRFNTLSLKPRSRAKRSLNEWLSIEKEFGVVNPDTLRNMQGTVLFTMPLLGDYQNPKYIAAEVNNAYEHLRYILENAPNIKIQLNPEDKLGYSTLRGLLENYFGVLHFDSQTHTFSQKIPEIREFNAYNPGKKYELLRTGHKNYFDTLNYTEGLVLEQVENSNNPYYLHEQLNLVDADKPLSYDQLLSILTELNKLAKNSNTIKNVLSISDSALTKAHRFAKVAWQLNNLPISYESILSDSKADLDKILTILDEYAVESRVTLAELESRNIELNGFAGPAMSMLEAMTYVRDTESFINNFTDGGAIADAVKDKSKIFYGIYQMFLKEYELEVNSVAKTNFLTEGEIAGLLSIFENNDNKEIKAESITSLTNYILSIFPNHGNLIRNNVLAAASIHGTKSENEDGTQTAVIFDPGILIEDSAVIIPEKVKEKLSYNPKGLSKWLEAEPVVIKTNKPFNNFVFDQSVLEYDRYSDNGVEFTYRPSANAEAITRKFVTDTRNPSISNMVIDPVYKHVYSVAAHRLLTNLDSSIELLPESISELHFDQLVRFISKTNNALPLIEYLRNISSLGDVMNKTRINIASLFRTNAKKKWPNDLDKIQFGAIYNFSGEYKSDTPPNRVLALPKLLEDGITETYFLTEINESSNVGVIYKMVDGVLTEIGTYKNKANVNLNYSDITENLTEGSIILDSGEEVFGEYYKTQDGAIVDNITNNKYEYDSAENNFVNRGIQSIRTSQEFINHLATLKVGDSVRIIPLSTHVHYTKNGLITEITPNEIVVTDDRGVYATQDGGNTWYLKSLTKTSSVLKSKVKFSRQAQLRIERSKLSKQAAEQTVRAVTERIFALHPEIKRRYVTDAELASLGLDHLIGKAGAKFEGEIFINLDHAGLDTPLHEIGHIYAEYLQIYEPETWNEIVSLLEMQEEILQEVHKENTDLVFGSNEFYEEVFTTILGAKLDITNLEKQNNFSIFAKIISKFQNWLSNLFKRIIGQDIKIDSKANLDSILKQVQQRILFDHDLFKDFSGVNKINLFNSFDSSVTTRDLAVRLSKLDYIKC